MMKRIGQWVAMAAAVAAFAGCGEKLSAKEKGEFSLFVNGTQQPITTGLAVTLPDYKIGSGTNSNTSIELRNIGGEAFNVTSVELLTQNPDGSATNQAVYIEWGSFDPVVGFPHTVEPNDTAVTPLRFTVVFNPNIACASTSFDACAATAGNTATLRIKTTDPDPARAEVDIAFAPSACGAGLSISPSSIVFTNATAAKPDSQVVTLTNTGTCDEQVESITVVGGANVFTVDQSALPNGSTISSNQSQTFTIRYNPVSGCVVETGAVSVKVSSSLTPFQIGISTKCEDGAVTVSYDGQENGALDFTDVDSGVTETKTINIINEGPSVMKITGWWEIPEDLGGINYTVVCEKPATTEGGQPTELPMGPAAIKAGDSVDCHMSYKGSLNGLNATFRMTYENPGQKAIEIPMFGGKPKSCFEVAPGSTASIVPLDFIGEKDTDVTGTYVVYNCGNAPLTLTGVRLEDAFGQGQESKYWTLGDAWTGDVSVGVGEVYEFDLVMNVQDQEIEPRGAMFIDYLDSFDNATTHGAVTLRGFVSPSEEAPTASIEVVEGASVALGTSVTLSAEGSSEGSSAISGYIFYLTGRPATSQLIVNGASLATGTLAVTPDVAGDYEFAVRVQGGAEKFLTSDEARVTLTVTE